MIMLLLLLLLHFVHSNVLTQRRRMSVALVAAFYLTKIGLIRRMHMHVLLTIGAIRESSIAAFKFTFEWFLTFFCGKF